MKCLFVCAIGPVQDFIATARRSRDLWYGSWMLSELSKTAARALAARYGLGCLIFPAPSSVDALNPDSRLNVANRVMAIVSDDPGKVGAYVEKAIRERLVDLRADAFRKVRGPLNQSLAERQIADLLEYYWTGVTLGDLVDIARDRDVADALLAARKVTRDFEQFDGLPVRKSSLDGARESVIPDEAYPTRQDSAVQRARKISRLYRQYGARRGERLSGVDLVKRLGMRGSGEPQFQSTSHMAALPFMAMVNRVHGADSADRMIEEIRQALGDEDINAEDQHGALLYESRLREWVADEAKRETLRQKLSQLLSRYAGGRPSPYYALLHADGDDMGAAIDAQLSLASHRRLSGALSDFALGVADTIEKHSGVPIYAGGDDILAYLPLHSAVECAADLAEGFRRRMEEFKTAKGKSPTLSAGIAVVHHLSPLADALELARQAERRAKEVEGKNALAITVSKRSGVSRTIAGPWDELKPRLDILIGFIRQGAIAKGVTYEFLELQRTLAEGPQSLQEAVPQEAVRIVARKRESGSAKAVSDEVKQQFEEWLSNGKTAKRRTVTPGDLAQEMIVAGLLADAADLADGPLQLQKEATTP